MLSGDCPGAPAQTNKSVLCTVGKTQGERRVRASKTHKSPCVTVHSYEMLITVSVIVHQQYIYKSILSGSFEPVYMLVLKLGKGENS